MLPDLTVIIPAAGKGKRMQNLFPGRPKALLPLRGKPMLLHLIAAVQESRVSNRIIVVTAPLATNVFRRELPEHPITYATQDLPLGTGHAVLSAMPYVPPKSDTVLVLYADQPLISSSTIGLLARAHHDHGALVTMLTVKLRDFDDWRVAFRDWGRIVRSADGSFSRCVELADSTSEERLITEVNPGIYCFNVTWLRSELQALKPHNAQGELYLTDVLAEAANLRRLRTVPLPEAREVLGVNTPEQLLVLEATYDDLSSKHDSIRE
ncbi:MAG: hypothetical protein C5B51_14735 [Terriglobia bacterium]|nr:MAG: hypothetical protein C5B51_14735 [Terriglobia bacterium]